MSRRVSTDLDYYRSAPMTRAAHELFRRQDDHDDDDDDDDSK